MVISIKMYLLRKSKQYVITFTEKVQYFKSKSKLFDSAGRQGIIAHVIGLFILAYSSHPQNQKGCEITDYSTHIWTD